MSMVEKAQLCGLRAKQENGECTDNGCITSHQKEINDKSRIFYSFTLDSTADCNIMKNLLSLPQDLKNNLNAPITQEEISAAIFVHSVR